MLDRRLESEKLYKITTDSTINEGLKKNPICMIISTPPNLHYKYAVIAIKNNIHFFTEVNISSSDVKKIIQKKLSVRQSEVLARQFRDKKFKLVSKKDSNIIDLQKSLEEKIGLTVSINNKKDNSGAISFE